MDIAEWLRGLGLERYEPAFRDNDVDAEVLPNLTADEAASDCAGTLGSARARLLDMTC